FVVQIVVNALILILTAGEFTGAHPRHSRRVAAEESPDGSLRRREELIGGGLARTIRVRIEVTPSQEVTFASGRHQTDGSQEKFPKFYHCDSPLHYRFRLNDSTKERDCGFANQSSP